MKCPTLNVYTVVFGVIIIVVLVVLASRRVVDNRSLLVMRQMTLYVQMLGVYLDFNIQWPEPIKSWAKSVQSWITNFGLYSPECALGRGWYVRASTTLALFVVMISIPLLVRAIMGCLARAAGRRGSHEAEAKFYDRHTQMSQLVVLIGVVVYLPIFRLLLEGIDCSYMEAGGQLGLRLRLDVNVACLQGSHIPIAIFCGGAALIMGLALPIWLLRKLLALRHRGHLYTDKTGIVLRGLYAPYDVDAPYREVVTLAYRGGGALVDVLVQSAIAQSVCGLLLEGGFWYMLIRMKPWQRDSLRFCGKRFPDAQNRLAMAASCSQLVVIVFGLITAAMMTPEREEALSIAAAAAGRTLEEQKAMDPMANTFHIMGTVVSAVAGAMAALFFMSWAQYTFRNRGWCKKDTGRLGGKNVEAESIIELVEMGRYEDATPEATQYRRMAQRRLARLQNALVERIGDLQTKGEVRRPSVLTREVGDLQREIVELEAVLTNPHVEERLGDLINRHGGTFEGLYACLVQALHLNIREIVDQAGSAQADTPAGDRRTGVVQVGDATLALASALLDQTADAGRVFYDSLTELHDELVEGLWVQGAFKVNNQRRAVQAKVERVTRKPSEEMEATFEKRVANIEATARVIRAFAKQEQDAVGAEQLHTARIAREGQVNAWGTLERDISSCLMDAGAQSFSLALSVRRKAVLILGALPPPPAEVALSLQMEDGSGDGEHKGTADESGYADVAANDALPPVSSPFAFDKLMDDDLKAEEDDLQALESRFAKLRNPISRLRSSFEF